MPKLVAVGVILLGCLPLRAADRWEALSLVESGDNDRAIGPGGEVSRYQMKPETWAKYAPTNAAWTNSQDALTVAKAVMKERCDAFQRSVHRDPTDFEFYVLWNAPSQVLKPARAVSNRAERFCNLIRSGSVTPPDTREPPRPAEPGTLR